MRNKNTGGIFASRTGATSCCLYNLITLSPKMFTKWDQMVREATGH